MLHTMHHALITIAATWTLILSLAPVRCVYGNDTWRCVKEKNGIFVFFEDTPSLDRSRFKSVTVMDASIDAILAILRDFSDYPRWQPFMDKMVVLEHHGDDEVIAYFSFDFPWPISNRELVVKSRTESIPSDHATFKIIVDGTDIPTPFCRKKIIRVQYYHCETLLERLSKRKTRVSYIIEVDPGGKIPVLPFRWTSKEALYISMQKLRTLAEAGAD